MRDNNQRTVKIERLSQWKLEAEFRNHQNWWQFCRKSMWSQRYETTFIFQWIFAKIFTNFGECFGDLNFLLNFHQFWWTFWWFEEIGEFLSDKNVTNSDDNNSFRFCFFCHQFWWKFWWFDKIGEFLSDKNITISGENYFFWFWFFLSPILVKILVNHYKFL